MANWTTTLTTAASSVPGISAAENLDWRGGQPTTVNISLGSATSSGFWQIQYTMDDFQLVSSSLATWFGVTSAAGQPPTVFASSTTGVSGTLYSFTTPIAGVRMLSTGLTGDTLTMKVLQTVGGRPGL